MRTHLITVLVVLGSTLGLAVGNVETATAVPTSDSHGKRLCTSAPAGEAACMAIEMVDASGRRLDPLRARPGRSVTTSPAAATGVSGLTPAQIQSAYALTGLTSGGRTVAIVDAYGYPNAERDLGIYRSQWGLPACTRANGCLRVINQNGGAVLPKFNAGWAAEQALDLDAVSATCPDCRILLVQARSASFTDLGTAVSTAARQPGVVAISNSYGGGDMADSSYGAAYNHPGIAVTASTGDSGYQGGAFPASSRYVTAVGGTSLVAAPGTPRGWSESVWSGSGSGCTTLNAAPAGQTPAMTGCGGRAMADVAAVADPATGLATYAPTSKTSSSWAQYGGTSLSAPIIAGVYALSGNTVGYANSIPYAHPGGLFDVSAGSNGSCTSWCTGKAGWDGPTGLGTPNGTSAF